MALYLYFFILFEVRLTSVASIRRYAVNGAGCKVALDIDQVIWNSKERWFSEYPFDLNSLPPTRVENPQVGLSVASRPHLYLYIPWIYCGDRIYDITVLCHSGFGFGARWPSITGYCMIGVSIQNILNNTNNWMTMRVRVRL